MGARSERDGTVADLGLTGVAHENATPFALSGWGHDVESVDVGPDASHLIRCDCGVFRRHDVEDEPMVPLRLVEPILAAVGDDPAYEPLRDSLIDWLEAQDA